jgi:hypothetical protein
MSRRHLVYQKIVVSPGFRDGRLIPTRVAAQVLSIPQPAWHAAVHPPSMMIYSSPRLGISNEDMTTNPTRQLAAIRNWQTLASYAQFQGGNVRTANQFLQDDVVNYFRTVMYDNDMTPDEVLNEYLPVAKKYVQGQFVVTNWRNTLKAFQVQIHSMHLFSRVSVLDRKAFVSAMVSMLGRLTVRSGGSTENNGGVISIAATVITESEDTAMFALFHEIGHGVQTENDIPKSIKDIILTTSETGGRYGELFADAFAAIALKAIGRSPEQISKGAERALSDHGEDSDHPDWATRQNNINATVARL